MRETQGRWTQLAAEAEALLSDEAEARRLLETTRKCLDRRQGVDCEAIDTLFQKYARIPASIPAFHSSVFNCSALPSCSIACATPNQPFLAESRSCPPLTSSKSFATGCTAEWFLHGNLVVYAVALVVWAILNISRVLMVGSYKRLRLSRFAYQDVQWLPERVVSSRIVLPATKKGEIVWNGNGDVHTEVMRRLERKDKQQKREAHIFNTLALLLQIVWIAFLAAVAPFLSGIYVD